MAQLKQKDEETDKLKLAKAVQRNEEKDKKKLFGPPVEAWED